MEITSTAFGKNETIPPKFTCDGQDLNPEILVKDVPQNAQSLVLIMEDPDAPMGLFIHWLVWNIDPKRESIPENSAPSEATVGINSAGRNVYSGPCPPDREHRYFFRLYALDIKLKLAKSTGKNTLEKEMKNHILQKAELMGKYNRN